MAQAEDLYDDGPPPEAANGQQPETEQDDDEKSDGNVSILPKSFFGGDVKPGDTCTVRVEQCHEDDCEVSYVGADKQDEQKPEDDDESPDASADDGSMASMMN